MEQEPSIGAEPPSLEQIRNARAELQAAVIDTPVLHWRSPEIANRLGGDTHVWLKLELFQTGGSFKTRAAVLAMHRLSDEARARGVVTASGGNHAIAVAAAAQAFGVRAQVHMSRHASPFRQERCRALGAELVLAEDVRLAFDAAQRAEKEERLHFIHPFEGPIVALGTATLGLDIIRQCGELDLVIVPVGGGGLAAGVAAAVKQLNPRCSVIGVEPHGANTIHLSLAAGAPQEIAQVATIADSLGAPWALPYSFSLCQRFLDRVALISDDQMRWSMRFMFERLKLAVEPAGAAAMAALLGPLRETARGKRVGVIVCGANIDIAAFSSLVREAHGGEDPPPG